MRNADARFTLEEMLDLLAERLAVKVRARLNEHGPSTSVRPRLLTVEQAAVYIGRTKASVQHMIAEGSLPVVRSDRRVFLDRADLDLWVDHNKQQAL
jgi:excisionase family DNA binding protein